MTGDALSTNDVYFHNTTCYTTDDRKELSREKAVMANLTTAYILWFFFGLFGLHHFYLKRDRHAFLWWSTLGGFCFGWIRDSWRLPEYVEQANKEKTRVVNQNNRRHKAAEVKPNLSLVRQIGMTLMAYFLGYLVQAAWPPEEIISIPVFNSVIVESADSAAIRVFHIVLTPLAVAIGVHLVASIGSVQASFQMSLAGAYLGILWMLYTKDPSNIGACCLISTALTKRYGLCKKAEEVHAGKCRRISILFLCGTVYLLLWTSTLYFNVKITTKDGEEVPLREATNNFFKSPAWKQTKESLNILWQHIKVNGWRSILKEILDAIDPQGEANALKVLGLNKTSSQEDIKKQYKMLAKEWHPDRHKDPEKKAVAQEKFMEIQEAYEILSKLKTSRSKQNKKSTTEKEEL